MAGGALYAELLPPNGGCHAAERLLLWRFSAAGMTVEPRGEAAGG